MIVCGEDGSNAEPERKNIFLWTQVLCRRNTRKRHEWRGSRKGVTAGEIVFSSWHIDSMDPSHSLSEEHVGGTAH
jgi:hypothetical protein